ncbi:MAG: RHS repeat-associated core domain-containing protein, partial [Thermoanaerobaculia bacterium]
LLLRWTVREFDAAGRLVREIRKLFTEPLKIPPDGSDPAGATDVVTTTVYDDAARRITQIDPLGRATVTEMDARGRVLRVIDPAGNEMRLEYDKAGNRTAEVLIEAEVAEAFSLSRQDVASLTEAPRTRRTHFLYDAQNRLIAIIDIADPDRPLTTRYEYDVRGQLVRVVDLQGRETRFAYDMRGRRTAIVDAEEAETRLEWDDADRLVALIDPLGNRTEWIWDGVGRLAEERRADGARWTYAYDAQGNLTSMTDPNGTVSAYARDSLDRVVGIAIERGEGVEGASSIAYELDDLGRVVSATTGEGVVVGVKLDSLDRPMRESLRIGDGPERVLERAFDLASQPVGLRYPSGLQIARGFDALGRIAEVRDAGTALIARWKDVGMRQLEREGGNGVVQRWGWDANRRIASIEAEAPCGIAAGCDPMQSIRYARTPAGAKSEVMRPDLGLRRSYGLDRLDRIVDDAREVWPSGILASRVRWELDGALNVRVRRSEDPPSFETATSAAEVNERNQVTQFGGEALSWDPNGNLRSRDQLALHYDFANRLARGVRADGTETRILRDAFGRRVRETLSFGGTSRVTDFVLDGDRIIEEWVGGESSSESFPAFALSARHIHGRGIDELLRSERDTNLDGTLDQTLWPLQDELGTVDALTDSEGQLLARLDYAPWGQPLTTLPGPLADWRFLFQGREWNPHLRAYDFRNRHLIPDLARFAQEDPAGSDHTNPYQAMLGNWTTNTDPDGRVVVMMHGIRDSGEGWASQMAADLQQYWQGRGADPGQDVINLVNRRHTPAILQSDVVCSLFFGNARRACRMAWSIVNTNEGEFTVSNALAVSLDNDTLNAGHFVSNAIKILKSKLDGSRRAGEPISVIAHSHGTAMLLAAAKHRNLGLKNILLVGSDLHMLTSTKDFVASAEMVYNHYSRQDDVVRHVTGAGARGFRWLDPWDDQQGTVLVDIPGSFRQTEHPKMAHAGRYLENRSYETPWMSRVMVNSTYGDPLAIRRYRRAPEETRWKQSYEAFRRSLGLQWVTQMSAYYDQPYP